MKAPAFNGFSNTRFTHGGEGRRGDSFIYTQSLFLPPPYSSPHCAIASLFSRDTTSCGLLLCGGTAGASSSRSSRRSSSRSSDLSHSEQA